MQKVAFGIFLNFEKLALSIVEDAINKMTNDVVNIIDVSVVDEEKIVHNLYHGCIAATFIVNLYETTLNTIIGRRLGCEENEIFKTSHDVKLQLICTMYHINLSEIKSDNSYNYLRSMIRLRNDITHFKSNMITEGHYITTENKIPMGTSKDALALQFTKDYMEKHYKGVLNLLELICQKCNLVLCKDCLVIDCDGRDSACEFVLTKEVYEEQDR